VLTNQGKYDDAILVRQQALDLFQRLADAQPSKEAARSLALGHKKLAALLGVKHRYQESFQHYELARQIDEKRLGGNLEGPSTWLDLSYDYSDLGWVNSRLDKDPVALEWHYKALDLRKRAAEADPNDARAARAVASTTGRIGSVLRRIGRLDDALRYCGGALEAWSKIVEKSPGDVAAVTEVADAHADIGQIESDLAGRPGTPASRKRELLQRTAHEYETGVSFYAGLRDKGKLPKQYDGKIAEYSQAAAKAREEAAKVR
jgi:non-specific serine/threonine protein kinase/serine/threonine-protein kinase